MTGVAIAAVREAAFARNRSVVAPVGGSPTTEPPDDAPAAA